MLRRLRQDVPDLVVAEVFPRRRRLLSATGSDRAAEEVGHQKLVGHPKELFFGLAA